MIEHSAHPSTKFRFSAKHLAFCAMCMALSFVLNNYCKLWEMPFGGSITLFSMLVACLPGFWYGPVAGIVTGVALGLLNFVIKPYFLSVPQVFVDYVLAFGALGFSGFFHKAKFGLVKGYTVGIIGRFVFAVISGCIFWGSYAADYDMSPLPYSLLYNALYIFTEGFITVAILFLPPVHKTMIQLRNMATEN